MLFQIIKTSKLLVTLCAAEWFFTSMCFLCCFKSPKCLNFLSHCKQVKCSSSVWILSCCFKSPLSANFLSHCEQLNGSSPVWILSCSFKSPGSANFLSHCEQLNGSSPVWILSCSFKLPRSANFLSHVSNWMVLLQCEFFHVPSSHLESFKRTDKRAHEGGNGCCCCCQKMVLG